MFANRCFSTVRILPEVLLLSVLSAGRSKLDCSRSSQLVLHGAAFDAADHSTQLINLRDNFGSEIRIVMD